MARLSSAQSRHDALLAEGRDALLAGDKDRAQSLLEAAVQLDPRSEEAWLWLSGALADPADMRACLERVLAINPANEHAHEGLRWLEAEYGSRPDFRAAASVSPLHTDTASDAPIAPPVTLQPRRELEHSATVLGEALLHPFAVGALLGLLRLVGWLRPQTLATMRNGGPLTFGGGSVVALAALLLHSVALLLVTFALAWQINRVRVAGRGDRFDSVLRAAAIWQPGYSVAGALVSAALGLQLSPGPWRLVTLVVWALLIVGGGLVVRRFWRTLPALGLPDHRRMRVAARMLVIVAVIGVAALALAGIVTAALLR